MAGSATDKFEPGLSLGTAKALELKIPFA